MFERYTEGARRVVFFARYEAAQLSSTSIDTEHLLLGLMREGGLAGQILGRAGLKLSKVRADVEARVVKEPGASTSVDIPLAPAAGRVLQHANEEAERANAEHVGVEHLLLGLIREPSTIAGDILRAGGVVLDDAREAARLSARGASPAAQSTQVFKQLVELLDQLHRRRAVYHVSPFQGTAVRVEIVLPDERWSATFFTDGRVTVETFPLPGTVQDESALARLLERLGPAQ